MIDLYEIGVKLILDDAIVGQIDSITTGFHKLQAAIDHVNSSLRDTETIIGSVQRSSSNMAANWASAAASAKAMADAADKIHAPEAGDAGGWDPRYQPGGSYAPPDPYSPPRPNQNGGQDGQGSKHLSMWDALFVLGLGYEGIKGAETQAADYSAVQARLQINQATPAQVLQLTNEAKIAQHGAQISAADVLGLGQDYYAVTGEIPDQKTLRQLVNYADTMLSNGVDDPVDEIYAGIKSGEILGKLSTKNADGSLNTGPLLSFLDMATKVSVLTQGRVDFNTALSLAMNAGPEGSRLDPAALGESLLLAAQLGGSKTGVGVQAEGSEFLGGKVNQGVATILEGLKGPDGKPLLDKAQVQKMGLSGTWMNYGALQGQSLAVSDPYQWDVEYLIPALANSKDPTTELATIMRTQTRATGQRLMGDAINSAVQMYRQEQRLYNANTPAQDQQIIDQTSLLANYQTAGAGFGAMVTAFASAANPQVIAGLKAFDDVMIGMENFATSHPKAAEDADDALAVGAGWLGFVSMQAAVRAFKKLTGATKAIETVAKADPELESVLAEIDGAAAEAAGLAAPAARVGATVAVGARGGPWGLFASLIAGLVVNDLNNPPPALVPGQIVPHGGRYGPRGTANDPVYTKSLDGTGTTQPTTPTTPSSLQHLPSPGKPPPR